ncbi:MAG: hypothetical protein AAB368_12015 [bacterium]
MTSKIKKLVKAQGMRTGGDAIEALSRIVGDKISQAIQKAKADGKKTIQGVDVL